MSQKIDSPNLDVIVIGAGPAGGSAARELAKRGKKVLLIERSQEIGEPNYSTAGTPKETIEQFGLPKETISATVDKILFATPRVQALWEYPETVGYVLDFAKLKKFLAEDAAYHGAEIMVGTSVEDFIEENGGVVGVRYHGALGNGEARAKIIVDATGHNELANVKLKVNPLTSEWLVNGMEYIMTKIPKELNTAIALYFGSGYANRGYSWIFPMNGNRDAKVGTAMFEPMPKGKNLESMQEQFINAFPYFKDMEPVEIHAGAARADGGVKNHVYKNIVLVGDSAHQINPMFGEGIRHALQAGRIAAGVIDEWLNMPDTTERKLKEKYEKAWNRTYGATWRFSHALMRHALNFDDKQWDAAISSAQQLSAEEAFELFFHYKFSVLLKHPIFIKAALKIKFLQKSGSERG